MAWGGVLDRARGVHTELSIIWKLADQNITKSVAVLNTDASVVLEQLATPSQREEYELTRHAGGDSVAARRTACQCRVRAEASPATADGRNTRPR